MKKYKTSNKKINYLNNLSRRNIVATKLKPNTHFGEKILEKDNYILYSSGNQKSFYEFFPFETQFKVQKRNKNQKLYNNKSFINYRNRNNNIITEAMNPDKIMNISANYGYKESLNIKNNDPYLKPLTIHDMQITPSKMDFQTMKVINNNVRIWKRDFNKYSERNQGIRVIKANKSFDNIIKRKPRYRIKINNEAIPNNHKSKVVKITKINPGELREIYQRKYVKKNEYINNIIPCYISKYGKKNYEQNILYNNRDNIRNKYFINNDYEMNGTDLDNTFSHEKEICGDEESKNIQCPIHGNISITIHKNPYKINRKRINKLYE